MKDTKAKPGMSLGERMIHSTKQAIGIMSGTEKRGRTTQVAVVRKVDVRKIRRKTGLSQAEFAARFGFSVGTLRNWEQGHREPEASTRILLAVIDQHPEVVEAVLANG